MPVWDRINLIIYFQRKFKDPSYSVQNTPEESFYPNQSTLRQVWNCFNNPKFPTQDPWGMDSLGAVLFVLNNDKINKTDLRSVLEAFNQQRYRIANKNGTLGQNSGWEFGNARNKPIRTPFADLENFQYGSAYQLFQSVRAGMRNESDPDVANILRLKSVINFSCPKDAMLGEIGSVTQYELKDNENNFNEIFPHNRISYDLNHFPHNRIQEALVLCSEVYARIMSTNYDDAKAFMKDLGRIHRWLAIICYAERGSSAIALWTVQMMALKNGFPLFNPTKAFEHDIDFSTYLLPEAVYLENFVKLADDPTFQTNPARSKFIRALYTICKGMVDGRDMRGLEQRIVKFCEQNDKVDYDQLLSRIRNEIKIVKPTLACCGIQFWTFPESFDVSNVLTNNELAKQEELSSTSSTRNSKST